MSAEFDLADRARRALEQAGFQPEFPAQALAEARAAESDPAAERVDLTHLAWSSIDNADSRDLDQIEYAEPGPEGSIRVLLAISDVASSVARGSAIDNRAHQNTVSVYTAGGTFHLLPPELSTAKTSLLEDQPRRALVAELLVENDGEVHDPRVYPALVRNKARLTYAAVGAWLESGKPLPEFERLPELKEQLDLQWDASQRLFALRKKLGSLTFSSYEARAVIENGRCVDLAVCERSRAQDLIESLMVATNVAAATFLKSRGFPILERAVHAPKRWDRICQIAAGFGVKLPETPVPKPLADFLAQRRLADPHGFRNLSFTIVKLLGSGEYVVEPADQQLSGHFGLAVDDYSHSTAPNRRYADLVLQRLLFATFSNASVPYASAELEQIARRCTEREDAARKVERFMRKVAAADLMSGRIGQTFDGIVTGASPKGTYARLFGPYVEGKVVRGEAGMDVGERVRLRLVSTDPERGFIDFEGA